MRKGILKWLLITSITLVSTALLMFVSAYIAVFKEVGDFYVVSISKIVLLSNTFNISYLLIAPLLFSYLKQKYTFIVQVAVILIAIGSLGRYLSNDSYLPALFCSSIVAIAHIPIITAPYGLLELFHPSQRGYASSIPLFMPLLGINFSILYGMINIANEPDGTVRFHIKRLNGIIAVVSILGCCSTLFLLSLLKQEVREVNEDSRDGQNNTKSCLTSVMSEFKNLK
jgi:hypothetical protein